MSVTTEETWKVNGTVLNTLAYNIATWSGREGIPPRRGENIVIPFMAGRLWVPKLPDERPIILAMWVQDKDVDGVQASTDTARRARLRDNIQTLKELFGVYDSLLSLERITRFGTGLKTWTAQAECVGTLDFTWDDEWTSPVAFAADLVMPDPFWYESTTPKL